MQARAVAKYVRISPQGRQVVDDPSKSVDKRYDPPHQGASQW